MNSFCGRINMQGFLQAIRSYQEKLLGHSLLRSSTAMKNNLLRLGSISSYLTVEEGTRPAEESSPMQHKGLENVTVAEVLMTKGGEKAGSWLSCRADDTVYDAVKQMAQNNIGSLVVLKPGQQQLIAGILTERDYLRKVVVQDRSSKYTRVGEIMTDQDNLVTVTSDTNILHAMQLMTVLMRSRKPHTTCPCHRWKDRGNDIHCRCCSSSGGAAKWRYEAAE
ncbi:CBS domain-containing protein CBSX3, mitochondrial isoform X2 [Coffea arabica]|uniref:CBS domain-containing protein CBSX3, mitochondrial isoform X2 n=1 Tax=Coffea arabica TaxID=13443 RepID=A0A6P6UKT4_COFAR|nr:CBS domain-containing protein CBSX3, mitochondrial-like isoform X2 [Coffea arabica]